jgi:hypothetical protein
VPETDVFYEYSPSPTPAPSSSSPCEVCNEVIDVIEPTPDRKVIINLPATVEMATPNVYADSIEWMVRNLAGRDSSSSACTRTTTAAPASPPPSSATWPAPTASRAACSATGSAPATSAW